MTSRTGSANAPRPAASLRTVFRGATGSWGKGQVDNRRLWQGPLTRPSADLSPKGEVTIGHGFASASPLPWGRGRASRSEDRVRGPYGKLNLQRPPAERAGLYLQRREELLVGHLRRVLHPIAEIDIVEPGRLDLLDMVEDEEVAQAAPRHRRVVKAVDHREAVGHDVGQRYGDQRPVGV